MQLLGRCVLPNRRDAISRCAENEQTAAEVLRVTMSMALPLIALDAEKGQTAADVSWVTVAVGARPNSEKAFLYIFP